MLLPKGIAGSVEIDRHGRARFRRYVALCGFSLFITMALAIPFDWGRYGDTFLRQGPLGYFELPSVRAFLIAFLACGGVLVPMAYRCVESTTFRLTVSFFLDAFCLCCLGAW